MLRLRLSPIARITIGLTGLLISMLCVVALFGLFPDPRARMVPLRTGICETAAIGFSQLAGQKDTAAMKRYLESIVERNGEIVSMGARLDDGTLLINVGQHDMCWEPSPQANSNPTQVSVQLFAKGKPWGTVEACFKPLPGANIAGGLMSPAMAHGAATAILSLVIFYFYLRAVLKQLNPSKVIPRRVREALDTLAEGLLVLDQNERIVLANRAFGETTGLPLDALLGVSISRLSLVRPDNENGLRPWTEVIATGQPVMGQLYGLSRADKEEVTFSVSASPIIDDQGKSRGVLTSFENVTLLERKKRDLTVMVEHLRVSSSVLKQQNQELDRLATHDALTNLLTRRPFFERLDAEWKSAARHGHALSAVMLDVDHFKSVNDNWGHAIGDEVLRQVAACLRETARASDVVCRYGGEEFAVLLPHTDLAAAALTAERLRVAVEKLDFGQFSVTASFGVASHNEQVTDPQDLLVQADNCLYVAKRTGRNRVVRGDETPAGHTAIERKSEGPVPRDDVDPSSIPFHAVAALISALAYRDLTTAEHSRRVADLCVATAEGLLSQRSCYLLEIAALLHDIGKIGVPDKVLLKSGPLTPDEWKVMRRHDTIGAEIVRASFGSPELNTVVANYQAHFGSPLVRPELPAGNQIPLGARILAIADAYDSMVTEHVYRPACSPAKAFFELRRCAGTQFDPELVERFISILTDRVLTAHSPTHGVSRETALAIGLQMERFIAALDSLDHTALEAICGRVQATAEKYGAAEIAAQAAKVCSILEHEVDAQRLLEAAHELLDLCRTTQIAFLQKEGPASDASFDIAESQAELCLQGSGAPTSKM
ncbi:MAG: bifunctional diguanylate cyclase/phosphohydrolase [Pirellulaceae bacterium]